MGNKDHKRFRRYHVRIFMSKLEEDRSPYWDQTLGEGRGKLTSIRQQDKKNE